jgi:hypothetical protein
MKECNDKSTIFDVTVTYKYKINKCCRLVHNSVATFNYAFCYSIEYLESAEALVTVVPFVVLLPPW